MVSYGLVINPRLMRHVELLTLENMVAAKFGDVCVVGNEILQEAGEMVALAECHVGTQQILVDYTQVEIIAE